MGKSCIYLDGTSWRDANVTLKYPRWGHNAWMKDGAMLLIGGGEYRRIQMTTEYVNSPNRPDVRRLTPSSLLLQYGAFYACDIHLQEEIVLTGLYEVVRGRDVHNKVVKYGTDGSSIELPDLNDKRTKHGCSSYTKDFSNNKVTLIIDFKSNAL